MNKKNKNYFSLVDSLLKPFEQEKGVLLDLSLLLRSIMTEQNARGVFFMLHYYGIGVDKNLTLESIGEQLGGGLTRERIRQIIDAVLTLAKKRELHSDTKPFSVTWNKFEYFLKEQKNLEPFVLMETLLQDEYFHSFVSNPKGFIAFLNDSNIRQVVYRQESYLYPYQFSRKEIIEKIQKENKKIRRSKTVEKMSHMSKTVTYVPSDIRNSLLAYSERESIALNRLYELILTEFMNTKPFHSALDFGKTQSWKARQGKAQWSQVGIYISKVIFERVKSESQILTPSVSTMSYICEAFCWFAKAKAQNT